MNPTVLITDYVWPSIDVEKRILKEINANILVAPTDDESTLIECSSTYAEERLAFCENKAKEEFGFFSRVSN